MLQAIRDRVTGVVAIIILGLLAVPFVFFGLDSYIRDMPQDAVATVGESEITLAEFQTEFSRYRQQLRARQGDAYNDIEANRPEARREFLDSLIDQRLLVNHAQDLGLSISPATLAEVIRNIPAFQVGGQFDSEVYERQIQASGQSLPSFENDLMEDLLVQELPSAVSTSAVVTDADISRWLRAQLESRSITSIEVPSAPYREEQTIEPAEVEQWYEENTDQFMRPERVTVEYIELDTRDMVDTLEVDEETLRDRYEAVRDRFMTPERRSASHILIAADDSGSDEARARAAALRQQIEDGASFEELATENSDDPVSASSGGDLGWIEPGVMMAGFEETLFDLAPGEISDPVETEFGWHIIRLDEIEPPRGQSFEEAQAEILQEIRGERAEDMYVELSERLVDLIYADPTGLSAVAEDMGLELKTGGPFSRFGAEGVLGNPAVIEAAFSDLVLIERQASEPIEIDRNHAVVVRVTDHDPAEPRPLDDVREEIVNRLAREQALERARERAEELLAQAREDNVGLEAVAEQDEALELNEQEITRRSFEIGSQVLEEIFRMPVPEGGEPVYDVIQRGDRWMVVRLNDVAPGDPQAADAAQRESARQQIRFARAALEFQGLMDWLRRNTEVNVVEERI